MAHKQVNSREKCRKDVCNAGETSPKIPLSATFFSGFQKLVPEKPGGLGEDDEDKDKDTDSRDDSQLRKR